MPTSGDLKSGDYLFFTSPPEFQRPPRKIDPVPNGNDVHTIKIRMLETIFVNDKNAPETVLRIRKIQVLSKKWAKSQTKSVLFLTKYSIFIVNVQSGRFMYQSGRAGDEAKKHKSPATAPGKRKSIGFKYSGE